MRIEIPTPCHQDWNRMEVREKGRFCESCQKEVVDYTQYSRGEIFKNIEGRKNLCGRFYASQLGRDFSSGNKTNLHWSKWAMMLGLGSVLGVAQPAIAQNPQPKIEVRENLGWKSILPKTMANDSIVIKGKVTDSGSYLPLGGVNILLKETIIGTQTNFDGEFSLTIPTKKSDDENYLVFGYIGYKTMEYKFDENHKSLNISIILEQDPREITTGPVVIAHKLNIFDKIGHFFGNLFSKKHQ